MASREPPYDDDLNWIQFLYTGDTQGGYRDLTNMYFSFVLPMEREDLFLPDLECPPDTVPQGLHLGCYIYDTSWSGGRGVVVRRSYPYGGRRV